MRMCMYNEYSGMLIPIIPLPFSMYVQELPPRLHFALAMKVLTIFIFEVLF